MNIVKTYSICVSCMVCMTYENGGKMTATSDYYFSM